jgi:hypothetical protein
MDTRKAIQTACALVLGLVLYLPAAHATVRNQAASLTFDRPVQVSDSMILPPGTYWFSLADMASYPNEALQIFDARGNFVTATVTEPASRDLPVPNTPHTNKVLTQAKLEFVPEGNYDTLVGYFYQGDAQGHKLIYSKQLERALSDQEHVSVLVAPRNHTAPANLIVSNAGNQ